MSILERIWRRAAAPGPTPIVKRIVVLANSYKHDPGRCVAGRELLDRPDGKVDVGPWVRPVSSVGNGELYPHHRQLDRGREVQLLDIVWVRCLRAGDDPTQPENWLIDPNVRWTARGALRLEHLARLVERPHHLWLDPTRPTDRVRAEYLALRPPKQSLYLIRLARCVAEREARAGFRLAFNYNDTSYRLKITDPTFQTRPEVLRSDGWSVTMGDVIVCVSLAPPFHGHHYKLVAALFPQ